MGVNVGFEGTLEVSTDGSSYSAIGGANSVSANMARAMHEITDFDDTAVNRIAGLKDSSSSVSGHYIGDDAGQVILKNATASGNDVYLRYRPDGTLGFVLQGKIENYNVGGDPGSTVTFDSSFQANTAWTVES